MFQIAGTHPKAAKAARAPLLFSGAALASGKITRLSEWAEVSRTHWNAAPCRDQGRLERRAQPVSTGFLSHIGSFSACLSARPRADKSCSALAAFHMLVSIQAIDRILRSTTRSTGSGGPLSSWQGDHHRQGLSSEVTNLPAAIWGRTEAQVAVEAPLVLPRAGRSLGTNKHGRRSGRVHPAGGL